MTREQFAAYVASIEPRANRDPTRHLRQTAALALLGFAYILGVLATCVALSAALVWLILTVPNGLTIKLGLAGLLMSAGVGWAILKSFFVRLPPPEGRELTRKEVPKLFGLIDEVRGRLASPAFHRVLLDSQYNASILQTPRLGLLGWHRNHLVLGLPLLQGLAPEEFKGVLAHEFGHLSGQHGRFGNWLYRLRITWMQTIAHIQSQGNRLMARPLTLFLDWFWPKFNGHAFVLSRTNEYEADAAAARIVSPEIMGRALTRVAIQAPSIDEVFWEGIAQRALSEPEPPPMVFRDAGRILNDLSVGPEAPKRFRSAFRLDTNSSDTHPCLRDRLQALRVLPPDAESNPEAVQLPVPPSSAAQEFLGGHESELVRELSEKWKADVAQVWKERYSAGEKLKGELATDLAARPEPSAPESDSQAAAQPAPPVLPEPLWKRAQLMVELHGDAAAVPLLEQLVATTSPHLGATFVLARHYLSQDDSRGVALMEQAMDTDPSLTHAAAGLLHGYYSRSGMREELQKLIRRVDAADVFVEAAQNERAQITPGDSFEYHGLSVEQLARLEATFRECPKVSRVHVVRKAVKHLRDQPVFILLLHRNRHWWSFEISDAATKLAGKLLEKIELPGLCLVLPADQNKAFIAPITAVRDALVYKQ